MGLSVFPRASPKDLKLSAQRDIKMRTLGERRRREPVGPCKLSWTAIVGETETVTWSMTIQPASGRTKNEHRSILEASRASSSTR